MNNAMKAKYCLKCKKTFFLKENDPEFCKHCGNSKLKDSIKTQYIIEVLDIRLYAVAVFKNGEPYHYEEFIFHNDAVNSGKRNLENIKKEIQDEKI